MEKFSQIAAVTCIESAANTLTFQKLETGYTPGSKIAWCVQQLLYRPQISNTIFADEGDSLTMALCGNNILSDLEDQSNPAVYDFMTVKKLEDGTPACSYIITYPLVRDFSSLLGGGILIHPSPLYFGLKGLGLASATTCKVRVIFYEIELKDAEWMELMQTKYIIS